jgi:hypothetical protein
MDFITIFNRLVNYLFKKSFPPPLPVPGFVVAGTGVVARKRRI